MFPPVQSERILFIIANLLIGASYLLIPVVIIYYLRKQAKHIHFRKLYKLFAVFLFAGGGLFLLEIPRLWARDYAVDIILRFAYAFISWATLLVVIKVLPRAMVLRSPKEMEEEIARRIDIEKTLKQHHERLLEAEKTAKLGYGYWDVVRNNIELSDIAFEILGLPVGAIVNIDLLIEQVHPADLKFVEESLRKNLYADKLQEFYFRIVTPTMEVKHLLVKGKNIKNDLQETVMVHLILQDVSEIRRYMKRIELQNKKLKKIAWLQSHKMRSPIASIMGMASLLNEENISDPVNIEIIKNIKQQSHELDDMILEIEHLTRKKMR